MLCCYESDDKPALKKLCFALSVPIYLTITVRFMFTWMVQYRW
jgi:hypothetical protein